MRRVVLRLPTCAFYQVSASNLDLLALIILVVINTSLVVVVLVLVSYLVHFLRWTLQPQVYTNLNDILALVFIYSLVAVFRLAPSSPPSPISSYVALSPLVPLEGTSSKFLNSQGVPSVRKYTETRHLAYSPGTQGPRD